MQRNYGEANGARGGLRLTGIKLLGLLALNLVCTVCLPAVLHTSKLLILNPARNGFDEMTRAEKVWGLRQRCIKANSGVLWNDHGDILKRVVARGVAVPTKIGLADVLATWKWVYEKQVTTDHDQDALDVFEEINARIESLWDCTENDITMQSDKCIDLLADHLLVPIQKAARIRR
jgi:hypothetical protein